MVTYSEVLERRIAEVQRLLDDLKALRPEPVYEPVVLPHPAAASLC